MKEFYNLSPIVRKLICFWAFIEGGLGGILHLLHIPITGFVIGGFSVIINILIAKYSDTKTKTMLLAIFIVLLVKFSISPYSPIGAYVAAAFQGFLAILIFKLFKINRTTILIYTTLVMLENAIQKPLFAFIIFGKNLWDGILWTANQFLNNPRDSENFITCIVVFYFLLYFIWAVILAKWASSILITIADYKMPIGFSDFKIKEQPKERRFSPKVVRNFLIYAILVLFAIYLFQAQIDLFYYLIKVVILLAFLGIVLPYVMNKFFQFYKSKYSNIIEYIIGEMDLIKLNCIKSYQFTRELKGLAKLQEFVFLCIYSNVFMENEAQ